MLNELMNYCFCGMVDWQKALALIPAGTIVRDPNHHESPTCCQWDWNLRRTWVPVLLNEVVHQ